MSSGKDAFEERLMRLGHENKAAPQASSPAAELTPQLEVPRMREKKANNGSSALAALAVAMLLVGGGAFGVMVFAPEFIFSTEVLE